MQIPQHITELTRTDFEQIAAVANIEQGPGIILERDGLRIVVKIDETYVKTLAKKAVFGTGL